MIIINNNSSIFFECRKNYYNYQCKWIDYFEFVYQLRGLLSSHGKNNLPLQINVGNICEKKIEKQKNVRKFLFNSRNQIELITFQFSSMN